MKSFPLALVRRAALALTVPLVLAITGTLSAGEAPKVDALRAAKIATDYLSTLGPRAPYIVSITLDKPALVNGLSSWIVRWSKSIVSEGDREIGLRVRLDGSTARLVEGSAGPRAPRYPVGSL